MWPAIGKFRTPDQFRDYIATVDFSQWKPIGIVIHNTAEPTLKRWHEVPREKWMRNLESYYKNQLGWSGGPHLFVDDGEDGIGEFNVINRRGTHSPSFNAQWIGIEHVGDYAREDDDAGPGLRVKMNGIAAMAILCAKLGIDPRTHIKLHKEDPRTDHDCPGKDMAEDKEKIIDAVVEYMGNGGDHAPSWGHVVDAPAVAPGPQPAAPEPAVSHVVAVNDLNLRASSSAGSARLASLAKGMALAYLRQARNGSTVWFNVRVPAIGKEGWVASKFVKEKEVVPDRTESSNNAQPPSAPQPAEAVVFHVAGKMSTFGGPADDGMSATEGLAIFETIEEAEKHNAADFFMPASEAGAEGLGRRLREEMLYIACRWNYHETSRKFLQGAVAHVSANGRTVSNVRPMDWGPHESTGRATDLSPGLAKALGLDTDDTCEVTIYKSGK